MMVREYNIARLVQIQDEFPLFPFPFLLDRLLQSSIQRPPNTVLIRFFDLIVLLFNLAGPPS